MKPPKTEDQLKKHPLVASVSQFKAFPTMPSGFAPAKPRPKWAVELCFGFCFGRKGRHVKKGYDLEIIGRDVHEIVAVCRCSRCCEDTPERADSDEVAVRPRVRRAPVRRRYPNTPRCAPHTSSTIPQPVPDYATITADPMPTADIRDLADPMSTADLSDLDDTPEPCDNDTTSQSDDDSPSTLAVDFETSQGDEELRRAMRAYAGETLARATSYWQGSTGS